MYIYTLQYISILMSYLHSGLEGNKINFKKRSSPVLFPGSIGLGNFRNKELIPRITIPPSFIKKAVEKPKNPSRMYYVYMSSLDQLYTYVMVRHVFVCVMQGL